MRSLSTLILMIAGLSVSVAKADPAAEMTLESADAVLNKYVTANESRGGLCLIGFNPGATLDYGQPVSVREGKIEFVGRFGKPHLLGKALVGTLDVEVESKTTVVDARALKKLRVISKRVVNLQTWCPNVRPQYLVVLYPKDSLPSDAEVSINVNTREELDEVLGALTYLSPKARIKGKPKG